MTLEDLYEWAIFNSLAIEGVFEDAEGGTDVHLNGVVGRTVWFRLREDDTTICFGEAGRTKSIKLTPEDDGPLFVAEDFLKGEIDFPL